MGLSTVAIKAAKGRDKPFKLTDGGELHNEMGFGMPMPSRGSSRTATAMP